ncbi:hypothetical protein BC939DRAFT_503970 [Gamsiella multidivaricata]|uniref:uncharacterized protein n=1 Tax=Gamsiella multidivaricata TaxID=101098 RepID=UPI00221F4508|nr:uncharacterized protein BC939DRAFT_503970 [Gamsiella multidivaricata]KAI7822190.1 hypothetical protein BC939DRAFT_503970 [Gamsiella multidivaricata]
MSSTAAAQPQLAEKPAALDRPDKRPYPGTPPSENARGSYSDDDGDDDDINDDDDGDGHSLKSFGQSSAQTGTIDNARDRDSTAQPPLKTRKKPGRKPNPASPAVRKEQNRAAQRAFRDRKERHLQQLENMIKELKDTHHHASVRFQRESQQLKGIIESLQSENYYLREVVFSFESALGKTGNAALLQDVKAELYRRHYENHAARKLSFSAPQQHPSPATSSMTADSPVLAPAQVPAPSPLPVPMPGPVPVDDSIPHATQVQMLNQALTAAMAAHAAAMTANASGTSSASASVNAKANTNAVKQAFVPSQMPLNNMSSSSPTPSTTSNAWTPFGLADPQDDNIFSMNSDVLYKAPSMFSPSGSDDGKMNTPAAPFDPLAAARSNLTASASWLPKQTFDDLHATLFAQTNLQSGGNGSSSGGGKMSSPQNVTANANLFGQLHDQTAFSPNQNGFTFSVGSMDNGFSSHTPSFLDSDDVDTNEFSMATPTMAFDDGLKQNVLPSYRLQMELRTLASAPPATDPSIDPKIYAIPHDTRIDLIPCPKLRAKMIIHQHEYDIEELCQLLLDGAICHGHPLDPHNWELPGAFFDRYGYLMGQELMKYKNKVWPKKTEPQRQNVFRNF